MKFKLFFRCPFFRLLCNQKNVTRNETKPKPKPKPKPVLHDNLATNFRGWQTQIQLSVKCYWSSGQNIKLFHGRVGRNRNRKRNRAEQPRAAELAIELKTPTETRLLDKIPGGFFLLYWDAEFCSFLELLQNCRRRSDNNNNNKMKKKTNKYDRGLGATVQSSCRSYRQKGQPKNIFILIFSVFFLLLFVLFLLFFLCSKYAKSGFQGINICL